MNTKLTLGQKGEQLVAHYLEQQGFTICAVNYKHRCGEIDIIAEKDQGPDVSVRAFVWGKFVRKFCASCMVCFVFV